MLGADNFTARETLAVFGANIRRARKMRNLTIRELAKRANYDRGCLASAENGEQNLRYEKAVALARALDVPFPALFSRNFMNGGSDGGYDVLGAFQEDKFMLVFVENFKRELRAKNLKQADVYHAVGQDPVVTNRILNHKNENPTIKTLAAMAEAAGSELYRLFSRNA